MWPPGIQPGVARASKTQLVQAVHQAPSKLVLAVAGGGSGAIPDLVACPGGSHTLLEALVPYAPSAMAALLGGAPDQSVSNETARAMAMACFERARRYQGNGPLLGVAATAGLKTDRARRGSHRIHVAWQTTECTEVSSCVLVKDHRQRTAEERLCTAMVLNAVARGSGLPQQVRVATLDKESIETQHALAPLAWVDLILGRRRVAPAGVQAAEQRQPQAIFPGAFHPLHRGHLAMARIAAQRLRRQVVYEVSVRNVEKPPLDYLAIKQRLEGLAPHPVWLTAAARFVDKADLFPGATFIVGADTVARIGDRRYYGNRTQQMEEAIEAIRQAKCRFLVFGRHMGGRFVTLPEMDIPPELRALCDAVPAEEFRDDVSSTQLRQQQQAARGERNNNNASQ